MQQSKRRSSMGTPPGQRTLEESWGVTPIVRGPGDVRMPISSSHRGKKKAKVEDPTELRRDPADERIYTQPELLSKYKENFKVRAVRGYWHSECVEFIPGPDTPTRVEPTGPGGEVQKVAKDMKGGGKSGDGTSDGNQNVGPSDGPSPAGMQALSSGQDHEAGVVEQSDVKRDTACARCGKESNPKAGDDKEKGPDASFCDCEDKEGKKLTGTGPGPEGVGEDQRPPARVIKEVRRHAADAKLYTLAGFTHTFRTRGSDDVLQGQWEACEYYGEMEYMEDGQARLRRFPTKQIAFEKMLSLGLCERCNHRPAQKVMMDFPATGGGLRCKVLERGDGEW